MNATERDRILFGTTPPVYSGGVARFTGLPLEKIQLLVEKGMLDPAYFHNCSPEVQDYIDFMEAHPVFTAHGYAYSPERFEDQGAMRVNPKHSIVLEGIEARRRPTDPPFHPDTIRDFVVRYRHADDFEWETDQLYCWYD